MLLCWEPAGVGVWLLGGWVSAASSDGVTVDRTWSPPGELRTACWGVGGFS